MTKTVAIGPYTLFADDATRPGLDILQNGWNYESHVRAELQRLVPTCKGFLDIGANVGVHSVIAKAIRADVPVIAVEMSQANVQLLLQTIVLNKLDITVVPVALASVPTVLRSNNDVANTSCGTLAYPEFDYPNLTAALSLDFFDLPFIDLVKIDVEGFEYAVWRGASKLFAMRPNMIFEFCPQHVHRSGVRPVDQLEWLLAKGYELTVLDYLPGIRKTFNEAQPVLDYVTITSGWITDILASPV